MNFSIAIQPLPLPSMFHDPHTLKLLLGLCLFVVGALVFSIWKERLFSLKEEERSEFLMFNLMGGAWVVAIFAVWGGIYFLFDSIFQFSV
jgi:hypothetical protein